jgi:hypothetical protein
VCLAPEGPGAESLRPAQARQPIPSVRRRGSSLCKRIRPGSPAGDLSGKTEKKEAEFSRKQDDIYGGLVVQMTQNSKFHGTRHQITQIADSASGTVAD